MFRDRLRKGLLYATPAVALVVFVLASNAYYPLREWLVFALARHWLGAGFFSAACLTAGLRVLKWLLPEPLIPGERLTLGFALGVLVFALGVFLGGLAGLYGHVFFFAWYIRREKQSCCSQL